MARSGTGEPLTERSSTDAEQHATEYVTVIQVADLPAGTLREVRCGGTRVLLANADGEVFAVAARCTHRKAPMRGGWVEGQKLVCPWHDGSFDLRTGAPIDPPVEEAVQTYPVRLVDGAVQVAVPS